MFTKCKDNVIDLYLSIHFAKIILLHYGNTLRKFMLSKNEVAKKLRDFAERNFRSNAELARQLGMKPQALQSYLDGKSYPGGAILGRLKALGCDISWLLSGGEHYIPLDEIESYRENPENGFRVMGTVPAARDGEISELENIGEWEGFDFNRDRYVFFRVDKFNGESMKPVLKPRDLVLIDLYSVPDDGDLVVCRWDSESNFGAVKLLTVNQDEPDRIALMSYNPSFPPIFKERSRVLMYPVVAIKKFRRTDLY